VTAVEEELSAELLRGEAEADRQGVRADRREPPDGARDREGSAVPNLVRVDLATTDEPFDPAVTVAPDCDVVGVHEHELPRGAADGVDLGDPGDHVAAERVAIGDLPEPVGQSVAVAGGILQPFRRRDLRRLALAAGRVEVERHGRDDFAQQSDGGVDGDLLQRRLGLREVDAAGREASALAVQRDRRGRRPVAVLTPAEEEPHQLRRHDARSAATPTTSSTSGGQSS
jgi:hypothetical protein